VVGQITELPHRVIQQSRTRFGAADNAGRRLEQVRAADRPDEHEVAREDPHGNVRAAPFIGQQKRNVFRRVPRSMNNIQFNFTDREHVAMLQ
jgi:hypothetical protein